MPELDERQPGSDRGSSLNPAGRHVHFRNREPFSEGFTLFGGPRKAFFRNRPKIHRLPQDQELLWYGVT